MGVRDSGVDDARAGYPAELCRLETIFEVWIGKRGMWEGGEGGGRVA